MKTRNKVALILIVENTKSGREKKEMSRAAQQPCGWREAVRDTEKM